MFDADYFRSALPHDVEATGGSPVVEVLLHNGHVHRVRSIVSAEEGWITFEVYHTKGDLTHERPRFGATETLHEIVRAVVAYDGIVSVLLDPSPTQVKTRPGFGFGST